MIKESVDVMRLILVKESKKDVASYTACNMIEILSKEDFTQKLEDLFVRAIRNDCYSVIVGMDMWISTTDAEFEIYHVPEYYEMIDQEKWTRLISRTNILASEHRLPEPVRDRIAMFMTRQFEHIIKTYLDNPFFIVKPLVINGSMCFEINFEHIKDITTEDLMEWLAKADDDDDDNNDDDKNNGNWGFGGIDV